MANFEHGNPNNKLQACGITVGMEVCKKPMRTISTQMLEGILYTTGKRLIIKQAKVIFNIRGAYKLKYTNIKLPVTK